MSFWKFFVIIGIAWIALIWILVTSFSNANDLSNKKLTHNLENALKNLKKLKQQNSDLMEKIVRMSLQQNIKPISWNNCYNDSFIPSLESETKRRLLEMDVTELKNYVKSQLQLFNDSIGRLIKNHENKQTLQSSLNILFTSMTEHIRVIQADVQSLRADPKIQSWREAAAANLRSLVWKRLELLQNPQNCSTAKKLVCNINKGCGFGCQFHHLLFCLLVAYGTQRTLILESKGWRYNPSGWETLFQPLSKTCVSLTRGENPDPWPGSDSSSAIMLPIVEAVDPVPPFLPFNIPIDIGQELKLWHGNPIVWWLGHLAAYLMRFQSEFQKYLNELMKKYEFEKPIVGRTDKIGVEANFHSLKVYMDHADEYFKILAIQKNITTRRIYLSTDEPRVISEARRKFSDYKIIADIANAKSANLHTRFGIESLRGILKDIHFLSQCDVLICTFSSQVCRLAYELMQIHSADASNAFVSLDDIYYFGGQTIHQQYVRFPHQPQNNDEIELKEGDIVDIAGNHWNGFAKGTNSRTKQVGLYPAYKAIDFVKLFPFPIYNEKFN